MLFISIYHIYFSITYYWEGEHWSVIVAVWGEGRKGGKEGVVITTPVLCGKSTGFHQRFTLSFCRNKTNYWWHFGNKKTPLCQSKFKRTIESQQQETLLRKFTWLRLGTELKDMNELCGWILFSLCGQSACGKPVLLICLDSVNIKQP